MGCIHCQAAVLSKSKYNKRVKNMLQDIVREMNSAVLAAGEVSKQPCGVWSRQKRSAPGKKSYPSIFKSRCSGLKQTVVAIESYNTTWSVLNLTNQNRAGCSLEFHVPYDSAVRLYIYLLTVSKNVSVFGKSA